MQRWLRYALLILLVLLIGAIPLAMRLDSGSIEGVVMANHTPVAKASVEARNVITGVVTHTESDAEGRYKFEGLRPGRYSLWVQAAARESVWVLEVVVERGQTARRDLDLSQTPATRGSR